MTIDELKALTVPQRFAAFVAWVGQQNPEHRWCTISTEHCALGAFAQSLIGGSFKRAATSFTHLQIGAEFFQICPLEILGDEKHGFVGALCQAKNYLELYNRLMLMTDYATMAQVTAPKPKPPVPTDAELEALEARPLVPFNHV